MSVRTTLVLSANTKMRLECAARLLSLDQSKVAETALSLYLDSLEDSSGVDFSAIAQAEARGASLLKKAARGVTHASMSELVETKHTPDLSPTHSRTLMGGDDET